MRSVVAVGVAVAAMVVPDSVSGYPDATVDGIAAVKAWADKLPGEGEAAFTAKFPGKQRYGSPHYWGDGAVYQIFVDRFNNGDASNDGVNIPEVQKTQLQSGDLYNVHEYRHGGDLKGIRDRLPYIRDLGMNQIWITPIFHNKKGDYHGYCVSDFMKIDPGFGTLDDMQELVSAAHDHGIRVILDIVVNHMCDPGTKYEHTPRGHDHYQCSDALSGRNWHNSNQGWVSGQGNLQFGNDHFGPFKTNYFFNRCGPNSYEDMTGTGTAAIYGDFVEGMFDFETGNHDFQYIFAQIHKYWIAATDVDGFRLDAVKHVTEQFVTYFSPVVRDYANSIGKHNFYLIGEIAASSEWQGRFLGKQYSNPSNPNDHGHLPSTATNRMWSVKDIYERHPVAKYPGLTAVYDFAHSGTAREVFRYERGPMDLEHYIYGSSHRNLAAQQDTGVLWNNLAIHDWPRFLQGWMKNDRITPIAAQAYLGFSRGVPVVYYGAEQGLNGDCWHSSLDNVGAGADQIKKICSGHDHALYRQTMWQGAGYNLGSAVGDASLPHIGRSQVNTHSANWEQDPYLNRDQPLYDEIRKIYHIRQSCVALTRGSTTFRWMQRNTGNPRKHSIIAFSRLYEGREAVVLINPSLDETEIPSFAIDASVNGEWGHTYKDLASDLEATIKVGPGWAQLDFGSRTLRPGQFAVLVHSSAVGDYNDYLRTHLCKP